LSDPGAHALSPDNKLLAVLSSTVSSGPSFRYLLHLYSAASLRPHPNPLEVPVANASPAVEPVFIRFDVANGALWALDSSGVHADYLAVDDRSVNIEGECSALTSSGDLLDVIADPKDPLSLWAAQIDASAVPPGPPKLQLVRYRVDLTADPPTLDCTVLDTPVDLNTNESAHVAAFSPDGLRLSVSSQTDTDANWKLYERAVPVGGQDGVFELTQVYPNEASPAESGSFSGKLIDDIAFDATGRYVQILLEDATSGALELQIFNTTQSAALSTP
jgi:hypothetical protein